MQKRSRFLALNAGVLLWGFGAREARADLIPLPATLNQFVNADGSSNGNFTTVQQPNELDTFSNFTYSTDPNPSPPTSADIKLSAYLPPLSPESGLTFGGGFSALPGQSIDYAFSYTATAPAGFLIDDAVLSAAMGNNDGTGTVSIVELLSFPGGPSSAIEVSLPGVASASLDFPGAQSINVQIDMFINGGTLGANVTSFNQGFSSDPVVPEPNSMISLSIGMASLLAAYRRFSKRR